MIRGIHQVALNTSKFHQLVKFYRDAFGFLPAVIRIQQCAPDHAFALEQLGTVSFK